MPKNTTPALAQWFAIKERHPDALVFFHMGDFFELFFADAETAAAALDIQLTSRGEHEGRKVPMCGVPAQAAEVYLARLIRRGFRVAIAEQLESAAERRGTAPLRREVVRLVTPGTLTDEALLEPGRLNLLLSLVQGKDAIGAAWLDISTGLFETEALAVAALPALLARLDPAEILAPPALPLGSFAARLAPGPAAKDAPTARAQLAEHFAVASLDALGAFTDAEAMAAALALAYVGDTQGGQVPRLAPPAPRHEASIMAIDAASRGSLAILRTPDGGTAHTLIATIDRTLSAAGARALSLRLAAPTTDRDLIALRQDTWSWLLANPSAAESLREPLRASPDMSRALARLSIGRGGARDLASLRDGLAAAHRASSLLAAQSLEAESSESVNSPPEDNLPPLPALLAAARQALAAAPELAECLEAALAPRPPVRADEAGAIAGGFDPELDSLRALRDGTRGAIAGLEKTLAARLRVPSLKIRYHARLGYVIEVPQQDVERLQAEPAFLLRQGMAHGARFSGPELALLDERVRGAADQALAREQALIGTLTKAALAESDTIATAAAALAELDVALSSAVLASGERWCRPVVTDDLAFRIRAGRHPVVEAALGLGAGFVTNDCDLSPDRRIALLTGPNMAGKSTWLRQNALIAILAQAGLPVPAESAEIGVVDQLFSRVGAADDLARGQSTFMVEMTEIAAILRQAGPKSLVVVDEIGRGTATLDGLAIAWAVLEALHNQLRCRTLFATHFHELARLSSELPRLKPHQMRVKHWQGTVVFLHEVAVGAAGRSFGVAVAKLAGVPAPVIARATKLLSLLEERGAALTEPAELPLFAAAHVPDAEPPSTPPDPIHAMLADCEPDTLSPRGALEFLYRLKAALPVRSGP